MIEKDHIENIVKESIKGTELFLAGVKVSASNRIIIMADTKAGITIDECALLHRQIESKLDRDKEDFELLVSSPGLDLPFQVIEQYEKNEGRMVEVLEKEGVKHTGTLKNVTKGGFDLLTEKKIKGKGKEQKVVSFNFEQVKATRVLLTIK